MGFFDFFRGPDINQYVQEQRTVIGSILLDVREPWEYKEGHISGSINIPLSAMDKIKDAVDNKDTPLYVYCQSGSRSSRATALLQEMGYQQVKNIGGIAAWKGQVEK